MNKRLGIPLIAAACMLLYAACSQTSEPDPGVTDNIVDDWGGYNQYGYNYNALRFHGIADGIDWVWDGAYFGNTAHANDEVSIKWNNQWIFGLRDHWRRPPYDAKAHFLWKGRNSDGRQILWMYDIFWVGPELTASDQWVEGGYPIWGQFEVVFAGNTKPDEDFWETQTLPEGTVIPF